MPEGDFITRDLAHDQEVYKLKAENKKVLEHERKCNIEIWNLKQDLKNVKGSIAYVESEKYKKAEDRIAELEKKLKEVELPYILNCEHHNLLLEIIVKNVNDLQQSLKWTLSEVLNKDKQIKSKEPDNV